jgi:hypothetical protein
MVPKLAGLGYRCWRAHRTMAESIAFGTQDRSCLSAKNEVHGILSGASREVSTGSAVFSNELVRPGAESLALLLFLDQTSLET